MRFTTHTRTQRPKPQRMDSVECIRDAIRTLVNERQSLHELNANADARESNRLELGRAQRNLSQALIQRYLYGSDRDAA